MHFVRLDAVCEAGFSIRIRRINLTPLPSLGQQKQRVLVQVKRAAYTVAK